MRRGHTTRITHQHIQPVVDLALPNTPQQHVRTIANRAIGLHTSQQHSHLISNGAVMLNISDQHAPTITNGAVGTKPTDHHIQTVAHRAIRLHPSYQDVLAVPQFLCLQRHQRQATNPEQKTHSLQHADKVNDYSANRKTFRRDLLKRAEIYILGKKALFP